MGGARVFGEKEEGAGASGHGVFALGRASDTLRFGGAEGLEGAGENAGKRCARAGWRELELKLE